MAKWQPITTAPKNEGDLILGAAGLVTVGYWDGEWMDSLLGEFVPCQPQPTHWMKMPQSPDREPQDG